MKSFRQKLHPAHPPCSPCSPYSPGPAAEEDDKRVIFEMDILDFTYNNPDMPMKVFPKLIEKTSAALRADAPARDLIDSIKKKTNNVKLPGSRTLNAFHHNSTFMGLDCNGSVLPLTDDINVTHVYAYLHEKKKDGIEWSSNVQMVVGPRFFIRKAHPRRHGAQRCSRVVVPHSTLCQAACGARRRVSLSTTQTSTSLETQPRLITYLACAWRPTDCDYTSPLHRGW